MIMDALANNYKAYPGHDPRKLDYLPKIQAAELEYEVYESVKTVQAYKLTTNRKVRL